MANLWYCFVKYHQSSLACITPTSLISCIVLKRFRYGCNWAFTVHAHLKQIKLIWRLHYFSTIYHVASLEQRTQWHDPRALHSLLYVYIIVQGPQERVQILSSVAPHLGNLCWRTISATVCQVHCSNKYKITQALLHHHQYGAAATSSKEQETRTICTGPEQLAFLVELLHRTECTERSSYKTTDCSRKGRTRTSDILGGHTQKVLHQTLVAKKWGRMPNFLYERKSKIFLQPEDLANTFDELECSLISFFISKF